MQVDEAYRQLRYTEAILPPCFLTVQSMGSRGTDLPHKPLTVEADNDGWWNDWGNLETVVSQFSRFVRMTLGGTCIVNFNEHFDYLYPVNTR